MLRLVFILSLGLFTNITFSQTRKGSFYLAEKSDAHQLFVSIYMPHTLEDLKVNPDFLIIQNEFNLSFSKGIAISTEKLIEMEEKAIALKKDVNSIKKLHNIYIIHISNPTNDRLFQLAQKLETIEMVEYCSLVSLKPITPPVDIPPVTPNYETAQTYINANPGVNMRYAWDMGLIGEGINVRDVEYGINENHEDLAGRNAGVAPGMNISTEASTDYTEHGTAVIGIVFADKGSYGISGMAYGANEVLLFPEWQQEGYNRVLAVSNSIDYSNTGDVIIYEMQTGNQNDDYVPAEYSNVIWDLTNAASNIGIIIVAAAGNGGVNLDVNHVEYMNRGNSGAIIVGAGTPNLSHNKVSFSTYGSRVDVQGWGYNVRASGYGNFSQIGDDFNQNYTDFSGTSSATPIVASCIIVLQSYYYSLTGEYMTSSEMRDLLVTTGIPQGTGGHIGPLPNMQSAIAKIENDFFSASIKNNEQIELIIYPNPTQDQLTIITQNISTTARIDIQNSIGQTIFSTNATNKNILDVSSLNPGVYFVKIANNGASTVKKFIKN